MKFGYVLGATLWAVLGVTALCGVWTPSTTSYGIAALTLTLILGLSACER